MFKPFTVSNKLLTAGDRKSAGSQQSLAKPATPPTTVQRAIRLMYGGAATSTIYLIAALAAMSSLKSSLVNANKTAKHPLTASQINGEAIGYIIFIVFVGVVAIALWLWMARMNGQGKNWARVTATVLFCLWTINMIGITQTRLIPVMVFPVIVWLFGLGAVFLLWRPGSAAFFRPQQHRLCEDFPYKRRQPGLACYAVNARLPEGRASLYNGFANARDGCEPEIWDARHSW